jgi:hypothetical protein
LVFNFLKSFYIVDNIPLLTNSFQRLFSHSDISLFTLIIISFVVQKLFDTIPFVSFFAVFLSHWSTIQEVIAYAYILKCFPLVVSKFQVLHNTLQSILNWFLYRLRDRNLVSVFYSRVSSFPSTIC